jgi:outer membrane protein assembly factor BamD (BamD/ComL family)
MIAESECAVVAFEDVLSAQEEHIGRYRARIEALEAVYRRFEDLIRLREDAMEEFIHGSPRAAPRDALGSAERSYEELERLEESTREAEGGDFRRCADLLTELRRQLDEP